MYMCVHLCSRTTLSVECVAYRWLRQKFFLLEKSFLPQPENGERHCQVALEHLFQLRRIFRKIVWNRRALGYSRDELAKTFHRRFNVYQTRYILTLFLLQQVFSRFHVFVPLCSFLFSFVLFYYLVFYEMCDWLPLVFVSFFFFFLINSRLPSSQTHNSYHNLKS